MSAWQVFMVAPPERGRLERSVSFVVEAATSALACKVARANVAGRIPFAVKKAARGAAIEIR